MIGKLSPKTLFLIDGIGALVTALLLSQLLARFQSSFDAPLNILYILAGIAACFALYSLLCSQIINQNWKIFLKAIAIANAMYCALTLGLVVYLYNTLTWLAVGYFIGEIGVIGILIRYELKFLK